MFGINIDLVMRVVSINKYQVIYYDKVNKLIKCEWLTESSEMTVGRFRKEMERSINFTMKYRPDNVLCDFSNFKYEFNNPDATWFVALHKDDLVEKVAVVIPLENDLSNKINDVIRNDEVLKKKTSIYHTEFEAVSWLNLIQQNII